METEILKAEGLAQFIPVRIGEPDFLQMSKLREKYELLVSDLTMLLVEIGAVQNRQTSTCEKVLEFIQVKDPETWLTFLYVESRKLKFPGFSTAQLIKNRLVEIPETEFDFALKTHSMVNAGIQKIKELGFLFPLQKLYSPLPDGSGVYIFQISQEFEDTLEKFCSFWTRNEMQNKALPIFEKLILNLNELHEMGFMNLNHGLDKLVALFELRRLETPILRLSKERYGYSYKIAGDSFNIPNWSAKSLFPEILSMSEC